MSISELHIEMFIGKVSNVTKGFPWHVVKDLSSARTPAASLYSYAFARVCCVLLALSHLFLSNVTLSYGQIGQFESRSISSLAAMVDYDQRGKVHRATSIREIDFANFTFPGIGNHRGRGLKVQDGKYPATKYDPEMDLASLTYANLTDNGYEVAIVVFSISTGGSAIPSVVYIYGLRRGRARLLWEFETGDRADGGLRNIYADNGQLVIERYARGNNTGACCPTKFVRYRYRWIGNHFRQKGRAETLPNSSGQANSVLPPWRP